MRNKSVPKRCLKHCCELPMKLNANLEPLATTTFFISFSEINIRMDRVPRTVRKLKRAIRALQLGSWLLVALVMFVSSEFVLRIPDMVTGSGLHSGHHQASSKAVSRTPKVQASSDQHPASHDHRSCQLCAAPSNALAVSSLSQLGKTRLELVDVVLVTSKELGKQEHRIGLRSRAPPVSSPV